VRSPGVAATSMGRPKLARSLSWPFFVELAERAGGAFIGQVFSKVVS
jgi:hypothetical protein